MNDFRFAARLLAKAPAFTAVAAGLLAAGIGANAVIFSVADAILLRPLPVKHPEELVRLVQRSPQLGVRSSFSYTLYEALRDRSTTVSTVFGEQESRIAMNDPPPAEQIQVMLVTPEFFTALGVRALYGRTLTPEDAKESPGPIPAVLGYGFWRRRFAANPQAIGRTITLHGHKFVVAGVMPRSFNGTSIDTSPEIRLPLRAAPLLVDWRGRPPSLSDLENLSLSGRLKPGFTRAQAQSECLALWRATMETYYSNRTDLPAGSLENELRRGLELVPLDRGVSVLRDHYATALQLLSALAALLLLMVCANVAGLVLARGATRHEEIAVRLALGATRGRVVRQLLAEGCLVAALGSAGGILIALVSTPLLVRSLPPIRDLYTARVTLSAPIAVNWRVLLFSLSLSAVTVLLFALAPAIATSRLSLDSVLRGIRASRSRHGRRPLIVLEIALCTVLLTSAALLARTLANLHSVNPGFDQYHIVTFSADPSLAGYTPAQAKSLRLALIERVRNLPGVVSVAVASVPLMRGSGIKTTIVPAGQHATPADFLNTSLNSVTPGYFDTMGMRILAGRDLTPNDERSRKPPRRVVVNQAFARAFFPGMDPVGRRFGRPSEPDAFEIAGLVSDAKYRSLREPMTPTVYDLWTGDYVQSFELEVRTRTRPDRIIQPVRQVLASLDPALPFVEIESMSDDVEASTAGERLTAILASLSSGLAALLTAIGIYGLLAYAVAQRGREIGIRLAVGARPIDIGKLIGLEALLTLTAGLAAGLVAAAISAPLARSLLYGVAPLDPGALALAAVLIAAVAAIATAIPASRAARIEPAAVLRQEN